MAAQLQDVECQLEAVRALFGERQGLRGAADIDAALGLAGRRQAVSDEGPVARFDVEREHGACDCRPVGRLWSRRAFHAHAVELRRYQAGRGCEASVLVSALGAVQLSISEFLPSADSEESF